MPYLGQRGGEKSIISIMGENKGIFLDTKGNMGDNIDNTRPRASNKSCNNANI